MHEEWNTDEQPQTAESSGNPCADDGCGHGAFDLEQHQWLCEAPVVAAYVGSGSDSSSDECNKSSHNAYSTGWNVGTDADLLGASNTDSWDAAAGRQGSRQPRKDSTPGWHTQADVMWLVDMEK